MTVRHAEKTDEADDPGLTDEGARRAAALADLLAETGVDWVLSSDYIRTRDTAMPTAQAAGLMIELYDPRDISALAERLREGSFGTALVVGHSNTTPALVEALTGQTADPMPETEYDRLYKVWIAADGSARVEVERYGS